MVAVCATASSTAAAATSYQTGFAIFGVCEKQPMATAANDHQSNKTVVVTMAAVMVDQLRQQLQLVVENDDLTAAIACIGQLENAIFNKETLEATRIGRYVNDIRKQTAQKWPDFSKRCRALIKQWQKIAEYRPSSSCEGSSNGGTPQLVSPALRRGLTPRTTTPGKRSTPHQQLQQRVTSTELRLPSEDRQLTGSSSSISPVENGIATTGSYAPLVQPNFRKKISPQLATFVEQQQFLHKSASVGATMFHLEGGQGEKGQQSKEAMLNGIVLAVGSFAGEPSTSFSAVTLEAADTHQQNPPLMLKLKRSASGVQRLTTPASDNNGGSITAQSVHAARKDVQSTAMLVAQLSETLPQNIGMDLGTKTNASLKGDETATTDQNIVERVSPDFSSSAQDVKSMFKRRHHTRKGGDASEESIEATKVKQIKIEESEFGGSTEVIAKKETEIKVNVNVSQKGKTKKHKERRKKDGQSSTPATFNWFAEYPLTVGDNIPSESDNVITSEVITQVRAMPTRSFVLQAKCRQVVLLPYVDIGLPDWKIHGYPQPERFLFPDQSEWTSPSFPSHQPKSL